MRGRDCRVSDTTDTQTQPDVEPGLENPSARCHSSFSSTPSPTPVSTHPRHFPTHTARAQRCTCRLSPPGCRPHPHQSSPFTLFPSYRRRAEQGTHSFPHPIPDPPTPSTTSTTTNTTTDDERAGLVIQQRQPTSLLALTTIPCDTFSGLFSSRLASSFVDAASFLCEFTLSFL